MNEIVQTTFDYSVLTPAQVQRTQDAEIRVYGRTQKTLIDNGRDFLAVQADIGDDLFWQWIKSLGISDKTALNWMNVARNFGQISPGEKFESNALKLLSASKVPELARDEAKQRAETGEKITYEVARQIRDEHQARIRAEEEAEEERQIRFKWQSKSEQLDQQIAELQEQIEEMQEPVEVEVEKIVPSPLDKAEIERLQKKVKDLTEKRDNLSKENESLAAFAREQAVEQKAREYEEGIRKNWRAICTTFNQSVLRTFSQWPGPIDTQYFESDDWAYLSQVKETAQRFLEECSRLAEDQGLIIDAVETRSIP